MKEKRGVAPGVYVIMERDGEALFLHRSGSSYLNGTYMLPGGGVEPGESPSDAAVREVKEEVDVDIDPSTLEGAHVMFRGAHDETGERVDIFLKTSTWEGEPTNNEPHKCDELIWFPLGDIPETVPEYVVKALEHTLNGEGYSEFDWG